MMKLQGFFYAVVAMLTLAACSDDDEEVVEEPLTPISLTYSTLAAEDTLAGAPTDLNDAVIASGRTVTVNVTPSSGAVGGSSGNFVYTAGAEGTMTAPATPPYYPSTGTVKLTAWHPSNVEVGGSFSVQEDQTTADGYNASDLMYSNNLTEVSKTTDAVNMQFEHKLAKLVVTITAGTGVSIIKRVQVVGVKPTVTFDSATGAVGEASGEPTVITLFNEGTGASASGAIVFPAQVLSGAMLEIETDQGAATYSLAAPKTYVAGKRYSLNLKANHTPQT